MKKEALFAVLLGLGLGLIITYGFYRARNLSNRADEGTLSASPEPSSTPIDTALVITSPTDESLVDIETTTVAGTTTPNSFVVVFVNNEEHITTADESGNFSVEVKLELGSNIISIQAVDEDGHASIKEVAVVYTTSEFGIEASPSPAATASAKPSAKPTVKPTPKP